MKQTKLSLPRRVKIGEKPFWQVTTPAPGGGRIRKTFKDREEARIFYERSKIQLAQYGQAAMIDDRTRTDAARAAEILEGTGKSIVDAAKFFRDHLDRVKGGVAIKKAVADFLALKKAEGASERHQTNLKNRLDRFLRDIPDTATTANVLVGDIDKFLSELGCGPQTCMHFRTILNTFFRWCKKKKLPRQQNLCEQGGSGSFASA